MTKELNRITITLSERHSHYIDEYARRTNMPKSSIVQLAVETLMTNRENMDTFKRMVEIAEKQEQQLDLLENEI